jgi:hypothetical protein
MMDCEPMATHMIPNMKLSVDPNLELFDPSVYK